MIKTPLRYPGGKSKAIKVLEKYIPNDWSEYREPMVGGGSMFIYLMQKFYNKKIWINDIYSNLIKFWTMLRDDYLQIYKPCKDIKINNDKDTAKHIFNFLLKKEEKSASDFYFINKTSFSGLTENSSYAPQAFDQNFTLSCLEKLNQTSILIKDVKITNMNYYNLLEEKGENVFIYLDPPYYIETNLYGKKGEFHKNFNHELFAENVKKCKHKCMISYNDCEFVRNLFAGYRFECWNHKYVMQTNRKINSGVHKKGEEIIILNY